MNILEAVKELSTNPKAKFIAFTTDSREERRMYLKRDFYRGEPVDRLMFQGSESKRERAVIASYLPFLQREDFFILYEDDIRQLSAAEIKIKVAALLDELSRRAR